MSEEEKFLPKIQTFKWTTLYMSTLHARNPSETRALSTQNRKELNKALCSLHTKASPSLLYPSNTSSRLEHPQS